MTTTVFAAPPSAAPRSAEPTGYACTPANGPSDRRRWATLGVLCVSLLVIGMDSTVLNVALPHLATDLGATASQLQWVVDAYTLSFAGLLLTAGAWGDKYGRRLTLQAGLLVFAVASVCGAFAGSAELLIAARAVMGLGAAMIMPSTLSILTNTFTDPVERKKAIGIWAGFSGIGIAVGPAVGGWLLQNFWWGSVFLIFIPIALSGFALGFRFVPESRTPAGPPLDLVGAGLSIVGLASLVWTVIEAPSYGWADPVTFVGFAIAIAVLTAFARWELRTQHPMLNLRFFRDRRFSVPAISIAAVFFALFGSAFFLSIYLQTVAGYNALEAGIRIVPIALGLVFGAPLAMAVAQRVGERIPTVVGLVLFATSLWVLSGTTETTSYWPRLFIAITLMGFGMSWAMGPATEAVMGALPRSQAGVGSAVNDTTRQVGGALGVAVLVSILNSVYSGHLRAGLAGTAGTSGTAGTDGLPISIAGPAEDNVQAAFAIAKQLPADVGARLVAAASSAFIDAMHVTVLVAAGIVLAGAAVAAMFLPDHGTDPDDVKLAADHDDLSAERVTVGA